MRNMDSSPNWCPNCKMETEWLIIPAQPSFVQCKECGHIKKFPALKVEKPKLEKSSVKEKTTISSSEYIVDIGMALQVVVQSVLGGFLLGGIWLILGLLMVESNFILATLFFILFGITASTIGVYFILCKAEEIAEKKSKKK